MSHSTNIPDDELRQLRLDALKLEHLMDGGVEDWDSYTDALSEYNRIEMRSINTNIILGDLPPETYWRSHE